MKLETTQRQIIRLWVGVHVVTMSLGLIGLGIEYFESGLLTAIPLLLFALVFLVFTYLALKKVSPHTLMFVLALVWGVMAYASVGFASGGPLFLISSVALFGVIARPKLSIFGMLLIVAPLIVLIGVVLSGVYLPMPSDPIAHLSSANIWLSLVAGGVATALIIFMALHITISKVTEHYEMIRHILDSVPGIVVI